MVLLEDKVATDECPFCGTHLENKPEAVEGMLPPESLIPFRLDLRDARESFTKWLHSLWFAPTEAQDARHPRANSTASTSRTGRTTR